MSASTPLHALHAAGQSIWLDFIDRTLLQGDALARRIRDDALTGMTSNPTIFEKALAAGTAYDAQLKAAAPGKSAWELFELVETDDVRTACDIFRPVYDASGKRDGYVSIEVSPGAAHDAKATVAEAHRLWATVDRPNVMIKVPGTPEGCIALEQLIADGLNVNVTLLFAVEAHARVIEAYLKGLERRAAARRPLDHVASVASFFVSRVDSAIDAALAAQVKAGTLGADRAGALQGKAAIANAKRAYRLFREKFSGPRWAALAAKGAQLQRPLWASTSTKNPAYRDTIYVEELIGPDTVNTMPPNTLEAFRDHGVTRRTVDVDLAAADALLAELETVGIRLDAVTDTLLAEGLASFQKSFDTLIAGIEQKTAALAAR
ncbi:transaldolase [Pseudogemmatithrix spongiicola]|uniref:Transaldolase n=1 Tax=Pseudogemmatithrix spongiicola TaxID=3062599 RepID=A0AA49Q488_9BACT|nr:transaldolase [Gemmatimonadaceae bacterium 'strain 138']WKW14531.1 transaldolase [Gemmatimonadaceae bacterium 'strain 318']